MNKLGRLLEYKTRETKTKSEEIAAKRLEEQGWKVIRPEWPALLAVNLETGIFKLIQVIQHGGRLSKKKLRSLGVLEGLGFDVVLLTTPRVTYLEPKEEKIKPVFLPKKRDFKEIHFDQPFKEKEKVWDPANPKIATTEEVQRLNKQEDEDADLWKGLIIVPISSFNPIVPTTQKGEETPQPESPSMTMDIGAEESSPTIIRESSYIEPQENQPTSLRDYIQPQSIQSPNIIDVDPLRKRASKIRGHIDMELLQSCKYYKNRFCQRCSPSHPNENCPDLSKEGGLKAIII